jgi:hypothetical protein
MSDAEDDDEEGGRRHSVSDQPGVDPLSIASRFVWPVTMCQINQVLTLYQ